MNSIRSSDNERDIIIFMSEFDSSFIRFKNTYATNF